MAFRPRPAAGFLFAGLLVAALGCGKDSSAGTPPGPPPGPGGPPQTAGSGNQLYDQHCLRCHSIDGSGKRGKGPDLSKAGADPAHTAGWIADHIKNPKVHKHGSTMPEFEGKLTPELIQELAEFLAAKK
jgi:mono/diheme cytochrome c family protein